MTIYSRFTLALMAVLLAAACFLLYTTAASAADWSSGLQPLPGKTKVVPKDECAGGGGKIRRYASRSCGAGTYLPLPCREWVDIGGGYYMWKWC